MDGRGASRFPGRWNYPGIAMVYTSSAISLATLEILVHMDSYEILRQFVILPLEIPAKYVDKLDITELPKNWNAPIPVPWTREKGSSWIMKESSAVIQVPSAVIPMESNYLINPSHRDISKIKVGKSFAFPFDERLHRSLSDSFS